MITMEIKAGMAVAHVKRSTAANAMYKPYSVSLFESMCLSDIGITIANKLPKNPERPKATLKVTVNACHNIFKILSINPMSRFLLT